MLGSSTKNTRRFIFIGVSLYVVHLTLFYQRLSTYLNFLIICHQNMSFFLHWSTFFSTWNIFFKHKYINGDHSFITLFYKESLKFRFFTYIITYSSVTEINILYTNQIGIWAWKLVFQKCTYLFYISLCKLVFPQFSLNNLLFYEAC